MATSGPGTEPVSRAAVLAYRAAAHDLEGPARRVGDCAVLATGVQDTPPGTTAHLALRARTARTAGGVDDPGLALVHSLRGTMHLHRAADLDLLAAALRPDDAADLPPTTHGGFFRSAAADGIPVTAALDTVAGAMRQVMADGEDRSKGALSTAVSAVVPPRLRPWCAGCRVHHVDDGLFRMASLQAGLRLHTGGDGPARFRPATGRPAHGDAAPARRELTRRFLRLCGPCTHHQLAAWLGMTPAAARRWWRLLDGELAVVDVDGRRAELHRDDLPALRAATPPVAVRLLPPYDPLAEVADRELLLPDPGRRRQLWRATANPGALLVAGEVAGTWRQRRSGGRPTVTVTAFTPLPAGTRAAVRRAAADLGDAAEVVFTP